MAKTAPGTVTFVCKPTAHLRCPHFAEPLAQQFWNRLWTARLRIFGRLFPWVGKAIKELAGLPPDAVIGGENHENNVAYQAAHEMYQAGYASDCKEVIAFHDRQNAEWMALTSLPPFGSVKDWRAAAAAAGIAPAEFDEVDLDHVADCVLAWALARRITRQDTGELAKRSGQRDSPLHRRSGVYRAGRNWTVGRRRDAGFPCDRRSRETTNHPSHAGQRPRQARPVPLPCQPHVGRHQGKCRQRPRTDRGGAGGGVYGGRCVNTGPIAR
jgi:hypothetical protein